MLVPSVPTPMAGALYILPRARVHPVDVSFTTALKVFTKWGTGAGEFVRAMRPASASPQGSAPPHDQQTQRVWWMLACRKYFRSASRTALKT